MDSFETVLTRCMDGGTTVGGVRKFWLVGELAKACKVTSGTVGNWRVGRSTPPRATMDRIAAVIFGIDSAVDSPENSILRQELEAAYTRADEQRNSAAKSPVVADTTPGTRRLIVNHEYLSSALRETGAISDDFARIENVIKAVFVATNAQLRILAVNDTWPQYHLVKDRSELGKIAWNSFKYVTAPTGNPDTDEESLVRVGYESHIFKFNPHRNEVIGLVVGASAGYQKFELYPIKFRTKLALIEEQLPHACISGGCLMVNNEGTRLLTHRRATGNDRVVEAGGKKHTFCGSMIVKSSELSPFEIDGSLRRAAERETREESWGDPDTGSGKVVCMWWSETKNHASTQLVHEGLDVVCLGARFFGNADLLTHERYVAHIDGLGPDDMKPEGYVEERLITPEILGAELMQNAFSWFPGGLAHILTWVALGAPGATCLTAKDCREILDKVFAYHGV